MRTPIDSAIAMSTRSRIFILSCGRAGTTALARHVHALLPDATVRHEPPFWLLLRWMSVRMLTGRSSRTDGARLLSTLRLAERRRTQGTYIETTPALWGFTPILRQVFPGCTLVHVVRDPYQYAASAYRFRSHRHYKGQILTAVPDLYPKPERLGRLERWDQMTSIERSVWFWSTVNAYIARSLEQEVATWHQFHFEQLFGTNPDPAAVRELSELLGIREHAQLRDCLSGMPINASLVANAEVPDLEAERLQEAVTRWAAPTARLLGYDIETNDAGRRK